MNNIKQTQDDKTVHRSQFTKSASWIIGGSQVKHSAFKLLSQFCRSFDLFTGTCWVRNAHTAHLPKSAFTLAETLIVIGIIGVVAALTLPNLNHATGDKEKVTKVKKIYSSLTDAFDRAQAVYGNADEWFKDIDGDNGACAERFAKRVTEFMKVSKDCGFDEGCFSTAPYLYFDGSVIAENLLSFKQDGIPEYMVMLSDGTSIGFHKFGKPQLQINVDIDGPNKGKNMWGSDLFHFSIGLLNETWPVSPYLQLVPESNFGGGYTGHPEFSLDDTSGYDITKWVIEFGNLDYLKCPDELDWETQTSCK